jgi:hypothetical protein
VLSKISFIAPEPLAEKPIICPLVFEAIQAKVVPATAEVGVYDTLVLLQIDSFVALVMVGVGSTVIVKLVDEPLQVTSPIFLNEGVTVIVATTGEIPLLVAVNEAILSPEPLAAKPMLD